MDWNVVHVVAEVGGLAVTFIGSIFSLGYWLSGRFRKIEEAANNRHLENLERFRRIGYALATVGYKNGINLEPRNDG